MMLLVLCCLAAFSFSIPADVPCDAVQYWSRGGSPTAVEWADSINASAPVSVDACDSRFPQQCVSRVDANGCVLSGIAWNSTVTAAVTVDVVDVTIFNLTIRDITIRDGGAHGAGVYYSLAAARGVTRHATFQRNTAADNLKGDGAGVFAHDGLGVESCFFSRNKVDHIDDYSNPHGRSGHGAGVYVQRRLLANSSTFAANEANLGAGVYVNFGPAVFSNCVFRLNKADTNGGPERAREGCGAFTVAFGSANTTDCSFVRNSGEMRGGMCVGAYPTCRQPNNLPKELGGDNCRRRLESEDYDLPGHGNPPMLRRDATITRCHFEANTASNIHHATGQHLYVSIPGSHGGDTVVTWSSFVEGTAGTEQVEIKGHLKMGNTTFQAPGKVIVHKTGFFTATTFGDTSNVKTQPGTGSWRELHFDACFFGPSDGECSAIHAVRTTSMIVQDCIFQSRRVTGTYGYGAAIRHEMCAGCGSIWQSGTSLLTITATTFSDNYASASGGAVSAWVILATDCLFLHNSADFTGSLETLASGGTAVSISSDQEEFKSKRRLVAFTRTTFQDNYFFSGDSVDGSRGVLRIHEALLDLRLEDCVFKTAIVRSGGDRRGTDTIAVFASFLSFHSPSAVTVVQIGHVGNVSHLALASDPVSGQTQSQCANGTYLFEEPHTMSFLRINTPVDGCTRRCPLGRYSRPAPHTSFNWTDLGCTNCKCQKGASAQEHIVADVASCREMAEANLAESGGYFSVSPVTGAVLLKLNIAQCSLSTNPNPNSFAASKCCDGITVKGVHPNENICHSHTEDSPWLKVDLGVPTSVASVKIWNRANVASRFGPHVIETSTYGADWTICGTYVLPATAGPHTEACNVASARYVRLRMTHRNILNLVEVEVYGYSSTTQHKCIVQMASEATCRVNMTAAFEVMDNIKISGTTICEGSNDNHPTCKNGDGSRVVTSDACKALCGKDATCVAYKFYKLGDKECFLYSTNNVRSSISYDYAKRHISGLRLKDHPVLLGDDLKQDNALPWRTFSTPPAKPEPLWTLTRDTQCQACPAAYAGGPGARRESPYVCTQCPAGTYVAQQVVGAWVQSRYDAALRPLCARCPAGQRCVNGSSFACVGMDLQPETGQSVCKTCVAPGAPNSDRSACESCELGTYLERGTGCVGCPVGRFGGMQYLDSCTLCLRGQFTNETGQGICTECPANFYGPSLGLTSCTTCFGQCPRGQTSTSGGVCEVGAISKPGCNWCTPGKYFEDVTLTCVNCATGTHSVIVAVAEDAGGSIAVGIRACTGCAAGKFAGTAGHDACDACAAGTYQPLPGQTLCHRCGKGTFGGQDEATTCVDCALGRKAEKIAQKECDECRPDIEYTPNRGWSTECQRCAELSAPQTSDRCVCGTGTYARQVDTAAAQSGGISSSSSSSAAAWECAQCPPGAVCTSNMLFVLHGYWAKPLNQNTDRPRLYRCRFVKACPGLAFVSDAAGSSLTRQAGDAALVQRRCCRAGRLPDSSISSNSSDGSVEVNTTGCRSIGKVTSAEPLCLSGCASTCESRSEAGDPVGVPNDALLASRWIGSSCSPGSIGVLCGQCIPGHAKVMDGTCIACTVTHDVFAKSIIAFVAVVMPLFVCILAMFACEARKLQRLVDPDAQRRARRRRALEAKKRQRRKDKKKTRNKQPRVGHTTVVPLAAATVVSMTSAAAESSPSGGSGGGGTSVVMASVVKKKKRKSVFGVFRATAHTHSNVGVEDKSSSGLKIRSGEDEEGHGHRRQSTSIKRRASSKQEIMNNASEIVRVFISNAQITASFRLSFAAGVDPGGSQPKMALPATFVAICRWLEFFNANVVSMLQTVAPCDTGLSFSARFAMYMIAPPTVAIMIVLSYLVTLRFMIRKDHDAEQHARLRVQIKDLAVSILNQIVFLVWPLVSRTVFEVFNVVLIADTYYLAEDMSVTFGSGWWWVLAAGAFAGFVFYVIGIPAAYLVLLHREREHLFSDDKHRIVFDIAAATEEKEEQEEKEEEKAAEGKGNSSVAWAAKKSSGNGAEANNKATTGETHMVHWIQRRFEFIYIGYEPSYYMWEVVEMAYKLFMVAVLMVLKINPPAQVLCGIIGAVLHLLALANTSPYMADRVDVVAQLCALNQIMILVLGSSASWWDGFQPLDPALFTAAEVTYRQGTRDFVDGLISAMLVVTIVVALFLLGLETLTCGRCSSSMWNATVASHVVSAHLNKMETRMSSLRREAKKAATIVPMRRGGSGRRLSEHRRLRHSMQETEAAITALHTFADADTEGHASEAQRKVALAATSGFSHGELQGLHEDHRISDADMVCLIKARHEQEHASYQASLVSEAEEQKKKGHRKSLRRGLVHHFRASELSSSDLATVFAAVDMDGSGFINVPELVTMYKDVFGRELSAEDAKELMRAADQDGDGESLSMEELKGLLRGAVRG